VKKYFDWVYDSEQHPTRSQPQSKFNTIGIYQTPGEVGGVSPRAHRELENVRPGGGGWGVGAGGAPIHRICCNTKYNQLGCETPGYVGD